MSVDIESEERRVVVVDELLRTAVHEAGHALMAYLVNVPFEYATVEPRDEDALLGYVRLTPDRDAYFKFVDFKLFNRGGFLPKGFGNRQDVLISADVRDYVESIMLVAAAGPVAEYLFIGETLEELTEYDWLNTPDEQDFSELGMAVTGSDVESWSYCAWMMERTWNMMKIPAHQLVIETLADKLVDRKKLSCVEVNEIITASFDDLRPAVLIDSNRIMGVAA
jgi:hypothetical protein